MVDDGCLVLMFIRQPLYELGRRDTISQGISAVYETSSCHVCKRGASASTHSFSTRPQNAFSCPKADVDT